MSNSTVSVSVTTSSFDVANSIGERLYKAIDSYAKKEVKTVEVIREAFDAAEEASADAFAVGEHFAGPLVHAFASWVKRSERLAKKAQEEGTLGVNSKGEEHTIKSFTNNQLSIFRVIVGREFKEQFGGSIGFANKTKEKGIRYTVKPLTAKPKQTVEEALAALIKVHGAFDVYGAAMNNEDIKVVMSAFSEPVGE